MSVRVEKKVRADHCNAWGFLGEARFFEFLEEARWTVFEEHLDLGEWQKQGLSFVIARITFRCIRPACPGDLLVFEAGITKLSKKTGSISQRVVDKATGELIAEALVRFVIADSSGKAVPIADDLFVQLQPLMASEEVGGEERC